MNSFNTPLDAKLQEAAEYLNAGRKKEARQVLREALALDNKNLKTWELIWQATYNVEEELLCLKRILAIYPHHQSAQQRLAEIQPVGVGRQKSDSQPFRTAPLIASESSPLPRKPSRRPASRNKRRWEAILSLLLGALISLVCLGAAGLAIYRGGYIPFVSISNQTATALAENNASCQVLIDRAIQASGSYCSDTTSNKVCYGNTMIQADLAQNVPQRFSERGDIIPVNALRRLSASPLNLENNEWGIAVFKIIANLPRSLPGETVTMVVFGSATLDNQSGDSETLESFYFSSELGQIACQKVPFDGMIITTPDGSGIRFTINGAELTLMGSAGINAIRDGNMEVSVYNGSARIVSNGEEQYFGAGEKVKVQLGGENGSQSISPPSAPEPLSGTELQMACTMTGQYCMPEDITPVSGEQAQGQIQNQITPTPSLVPTATLTGILTPTIPPTNTLVVLPTSSPSKTATVVILRTPTRTVVPTRTFTRTPIPATSTLTQTNTPTSTLTFTPTATSTLTPTNTPSPTPTAQAPSESICPSVSLSAPTSPNANDLSMEITNSSGGTITITRFFAYWVKTPTSQKLDMLFLNGALIWNISDVNPPSDIPSESNWRGGADLTIPDGAAMNFLVQFQDDLQPTGYEVHVVFDSGCQVIGTK